MYIPKPNQETRVPVLWQLIRSQPLGMLVTLGSEGLFASHIPMLLEEDGSEFGMLKGHIARANPQWKDFSPAIEALAIFAGSQHYISPNWYPGKQEHGKEVPTWNYVVVHAYGSLKIIEDHTWLLSFLNQLTDTHEAISPVPWSVKDAPQDFVTAMMNAIVGFELPIRRLEGKWKLSQNKAPRDRQGVIEGLSKLDTPASLTMRALIEEID